MATIALFSNSSQALWTTVSVHWSFNRRTSMLICDCFNIVTSLSDIMIFDATLARSWLIVMSKACCSSSDHPSVMKALRQQALRATPTTKLDERALPWARWSILWGQTDVAQIDACFLLAGLELPSSYASGSLKSSLRWHSRQVIQLYAQDLSYSIRWEMDSSWLRLGFGTIASLQS